MIDRLKAVLKMLMCFVVTFAIMSVVLWFLRFPSIRGESMEPTYYDGDTVLLLHVQSVKRGDVVIVWSTELGEYIVKRVVGIEGDVISIRADHLYRNGLPLYETYVSSQGWASDAEEREWTVGEGELFLLGDNRVNSIDSRSFGMVKVADVFGIVLR